jgi:carboxyl-terminal processing protease
MQKFAQIIMGKKFLLGLAVLTAASVFVAFRSSGNSKIDDNPKSKYVRILRNLSILLDEAHYNPKKVDDNFSKQVLKKFEEDLDSDKSILLKEDIESFKKYETRIDDEIRGKEIESFFVISEVYKKRNEEITSLYKEFLKAPIDFTANETVILDADKRGFAANAAERREVWRKRIKYMVLDRYVNMQEDREKNKDKKDFVIKADSTLEREARAQVSKQMDRYFTTRKNRENQDEMFSTFVNAITTTMDPHTDYFPPIDLRSFNESMSGRFYGIGALLKEEDGKIKIASMVSGGPAWKNGELKENDEILKIGQGTEEPVDVTGYAVTDAVKLIRGERKGTEVRLTVRKVEGIVKVITLQRDEIKLDETFARSAVINGEHKIGYIYLPEFYADFERPGGARCAVDVAKEVEKLKAEKVEGIVLDLRGNGGGSLFDAVQMAGLFIEDGPVCQVRDRMSETNVLRDKDKNILYSGPLTVMVDGTSASASEIFAAAIQDYKRGIVIGSSTTYGKGTVQRNIPLNPQEENNMFGQRRPSEDLGTVKLTMQKFYRINGGSTQLNGVTPDIVVPDRLDYLKFREKDNPTSLPWDEIKKADYQVWGTGGFDFAKVIKVAGDDVRSSRVFTQIQEKTKWIFEQNEKPYPLNIAVFREEQKKIKAAYKELEELYKLATALEIKNNTQDEQTLAADKDKAEKNKRWIKQLSTDIYINETVKVMNRMIGESTVAAAIKPPKKG